MRLGSVIIKVAPRQVADTMWYFPLLKPYYDHVPVKSDLSDLEEKLRWCRQNDDKCQVIADNARKLWDKWLSQDPCVDYVEMVCKQISKRFVNPPSWWSVPPKASEPPSLRSPDGPCYVDRGTGVSRLCVRCQATLEEEERKIREEKEKELQEKTARMKNKGAARDRMKKKAAEAKAKKAKMVCK